MFIFGVSLSSCTKDGSWFPDRDCVTKEYEVVTTLSPDALPPSGGQVGLLVDAQRVTHFFQFGEEIKTESEAVDYSVALKGTPDNFSLDNAGGVYILSVPVNNRNVPITITLIVIVGNETFEFDLTQDPMKYHVGVELQ